MIQTLLALPQVPKVYPIITPPLFEPYPYEMNPDVLNIIYPVLDRVIGTW